MTLLAHQGCVYETKFSPHDTWTVASCSADGTMCLWDLRASNGQSLPVNQIRIGSGEQLTLDWNKYHSTEIAVAGVDRNIRVYDIRMTADPAIQLKSHTSAVRRIQWNPHRPDIIASASYDMTIKIWNTGRQGHFGGLRPNGQLIDGSLQLTLDSLHKEFVVGLDWSLFDRGVLATSSWDQTIGVIHLPFI